MSGSLRVLIRVESVDLNPSSASSLVLSSVEAVTTVEELAVRTDRRKIDDTGIYKYDRAHFEKEEVNVESGRGAREEPHRRDDHLK